MVFNREMHKNGYFHEKKKTIDLKLGTMDILGFTKNLKTSAIETVKQRKRGLELLNHNKIMINENPTLAAMRKLLVDTKLLL